MIRARLRTSMMVCLALIGACGAHESGERAATRADALETFVSPRVAAGASRYCDEGAIEVLDGPPVNRSRPVAVKSCWARSSDTMDYTYRDTTGRLLVVGREIEQRYPVESWQDTTAPAELETLRAAVRNAL